MIYNFRSQIAIESNDFSRRIFKVYFTVILKFTQNL